MTDVDWERQSSIELDLVIDDPDLNDEFRARCKSLDVDVVDNPDESPSGWPTVELSGPYAAVVAIVMVYWQDSDLVSNIKPF